MHLDASKRQEVEIFMRSKTVETKANYTVERKMVEGIGCEAGGQHHSQPCASREGVVVETDHLFDYLARDLASSILKL
jgi:hypothetical protein